MGSSSPSNAAAAQQLVDALRGEAEDILQEVAQLLADVPDEQLFGDNEFVVRDRVLRLVAAAYSARLAQKKMATSAPASTVPIADKPPASTTSAPDSP
jgi:hypothetical protein